MTIENVMDVENKREISLLDLYFVLSSEWGACVLDGRRGGEDEKYTYNVRALED